MYNHELSILEWRKLRITLIFLYMGAETRGASSSELSGTWSPVVVGGRRVRCFCYVWTVKGFDEEEWKIGENRTMDSLWGWYWEWYRGRFVCFPFFFFFFLTKWTFSTSILHLFHFMAITSINFRLFYFKNLLFFIFHGQFYKTTPSASLLYTLF